jgi:hypothetical protein
MHLHNHLYQLHHAFFTVDAHNIINKKQPGTSPISIHNPNGSIMHSTITAKLDLPTSPHTALQVHDLVPALASHSLLHIE